MQTRLTCGQFMQITPSLSMNITCSFFYQIKIFFHLWISQEENYKMFSNMKKNGTMYEELKLKKRELNF
jgi:hypothetical protein